MSINAIAAAMIEAAKHRLGATIKTYDTLGGQWTMDTLTRALQQAPGVYVSFIGGKPNGAAGYLSAEFAVYCVNKAAVEVARREGTPRTIGANEMVELLAAHLDRLVIENIGSMKLTSIDNLFTDAMFDLGGIVYGARFTVAAMPLPPAVADSDLQPLDVEGKFINYDFRLRDEEERNPWLEGNYENSKPDAQDIIKSDT